MTAAPANIGYASKTLAVPGAAMQSVTKRLATPERLAQLIAQNLDALDATLDYCHANGIKLFRVSSDVVPFGSSPVNTLDWRSLFADRLAAIGAKAREFNMRLSMHPGQYTVLNSPNADVVERAMVDLAYHERFLSALGMDQTCKIVLHVGGAYGDKPAALRRFAAAYRDLPPAVAARLVLENDDRLFTACEVLELCRELGAPMVFDNLHHQINHAPGDPDERTLIEAAGATWSPADGRQKIHYSQQAPGKKHGAHAESIAVDDFLDFYRSLPTRDLDIMLEVKDKNLSAVKCLACTRDAGGMAALEREWARYKYAVLEHDQAVYQEIRLLLKDKGAYPAVPFYRLVEQALATPAATGSFVNAAQHVWGYFSRDATERERTTFARLIERFQHGEAAPQAVKRNLHALASRHDQRYLLESYYFVL